MSAADSGPMSAQMKANEWLAEGNGPGSLPPDGGLVGVDEMHPGNFLYYDTTQVGLGACAVSDIAVRVLTRVVGHYPRCNSLLIDCGWTGASAQGKHAGAPEDRQGGASLCTLVSLGRYSCMPSQCLHLSPFLCAQ